MALSNLSGPNTVPSGKVIHEILGGRVAMKIHGSHFQSNYCNIFMNLASMFDRCWFGKDLSTMYLKIWKHKLSLAQTGPNFLSWPCKTCLAQLELREAKEFFSMVRLDVITLLLGLTKAHYKLSDSVIKPSPDVDGLRCRVWSLDSWINGWNTCFIKIYLVYIDMEKYTYTAKK